LIAIIKHPLIVFFNKKRQKQKKVCVVHWTNGMIFSGLIEPVIERGSS